MAHASTHMHRHAHTTQHMNTAHSQMHRDAHVYRHGHAHSHTCKNIHELMARSQTYMCTGLCSQRHTRTCAGTFICVHTHTHRHTLAWLVTERGYICLPMPCFRPLGFWAHAHFHHRKKIIFRQTLLSASGNVLSHCFLHNPSPIRPQSQIFPFQRKITLPKLGSTCM